MSFVIQALDPAPFEPLFSMTDEELRAHQARRMTVAENPGTPCRVSLEDAEVGEEVILVNYQHQPSDSPYRSNHAVFIRKDVEKQVLLPGEVPNQFHHRLMSVRAFSKNHMMVDADAVEGKHLEPVLEKFMTNPKVNYIHLHYALPGCFAARVDRSS
ncbi:MAG: DUF1203 domain-containing protein [Proteobacteria bacterium]|nr:DUF1203 domain-containing protein [Pseudomonadota bacterium]